MEGAGCRSKRRKRKRSRERRERTSRPGRRAEGKRGMRRLPSEELAFTKRQNGTYRSPVISPYPLRTPVSVEGGPTKGRSDLSLESSREADTATRKMSGSSSIPASLWAGAPRSLKTHHPAKEFSLSRYHWRGAARSARSTGSGQGELLTTEIRGREDGMDTRASNRSPDNPSRSGPFRYAVAGSALRNVTKFRVFLNSLTG